MTCRAKGRFQDREYCSSKVIDQIVADGKSAIPVLISQIIDARWIAEPVYDFQPRIRTGELALIILENLFTDDTWTKSTIPEMSSQERCIDARPDCPSAYMKTSSVAARHAGWLKFWNAKQNQIYWDQKARCFRLSDGPSKPVK
jgi:hypothetical protein